MTQDDNYDFSKNKCNQIYDPPKYNFIEYSQSTIRNIDIDAFGLMKIYCKLFGVVLILTLIYYTILYEIVFIVIRHIYIYINLRWILERTEENNVRREKYAISLTQNM